MANQIGKFFASQGHEKSVEAIVDHLKKFWDPRMRTAILAGLDAGGANLDPPVRASCARRIQPLRRIKAHDDDRTGQR
jgi:formate dehydrogenase subunit delta